MNDLANTGIPLEAQSFTDFMSQAAKGMGLTPGYAARFTAGFARALAPSTPQQQMFELQAIGYQGGSITDYALAMARLSSPFQKVEGMEPVAARLIESYQNMPGGQLALYQLLKNAGISDYNIYKYLQHPFTPHTIGQIQKDITEEESLITEGMTKREKEIYEKYGKEFAYRYKMEQKILDIGKNLDAITDYLRDKQLEALTQIKNAIDKYNQTSHPEKKPGQATLPYTSSGDRYVPEPEKPELQAMTPEDKARRQILEEAARIQNNVDQLKKGVFKIELKSDFYRK
jgi:predicted transcriptional regulator